MNFDELSIANRYEHLTDCNVIYENDKPLFMLTDLAKLLNYKSIHTTVINYGNDYKVYKKVKTSGGMQTKAFLTFKGLKKLLSNARNITTQKFAKELGFENILCVNTTVEGDTLNAIMTAFDSEEMIPQYIIKSYRIDIYFPKYKLAIECDESHHNRQKNKDKDTEREKFIKEQLNCTFIRYKPHEDSFNIFQLINQIYLHIHMLSSPEL